MDEKKVDSNENNDLIKNRINDFLLLELESKLDKQNQFLIHQYYKEVDPKLSNILENSGETRLETIFLLTEQLNESKRIIKDKCNKIDNLNFKLDEYDEIILNNEEKIDLLSKEIQQFKNSNNIKVNSSEKSDLLESIFEKKNEINILKKEIINLRDYISEKDSAVLELNNQIKKNEKIINQLLDGYNKVKSNNSLNNQINDLNEMLSLNEDNISKLNIKISDLLDENNNMKNIEKNNKELHSIIKIKNNHINSLNNKLDALDSTSKKYIKEIELLNEEIQNKNIENAMLKGIIDDCQDKYQSLLIKFNQLEQENSKNNNVIESNESNLINQIDLLKKVSTENKSTINSLNDEIIVLKEILDEKDKTIKLIKGSDE